MMGEGVMVVVVVMMVVFGMFNCGYINNLALNNVFNDIIDC